MRLCALCLGEDEALICTETRGSSIWMRLTGYGKCIVPVTSYAYFFKIHLRFIGPMNYIMDVVLSSLIFHNLVEGRFDSIYIFVRDH